MSTTILPFGAQIALEFRGPSVLVAAKVQGLITLGDLLDILGGTPPPGFPMLRTTSSLLGAYLNKPIEEISVDLVSQTRNGFRPFLEDRKYAEKSIRTYVNYVRILLNHAKDFGWKSSEVEPEEWRAVLALAAEKRCQDVVRYLAGIRKTPREVTIEDVERWAHLSVDQGLSHETARTKTTRFWRLLRDCDCTGQTPTCLLREKNYGVPLDQFPSALRSEVVELLRWKQAEYAIDRLKDARHRPVTSKRLQQIICALLGFSINVRGGSEITSLTQLVKKQTVNSFAEWCINDRKVKGQTLQRNLRLLSAALRQHPLYKSLDLSWFKPLLDSLPIERKSESKKRKAEKFLEYEVLELIPAKIRAGRAAAEKKSMDHVARLVQDELLIKWLIALAWRQRNIRECRIGRPAPNLFRGKIPPFGEIDKPEWVKKEEQKNPDAQFWQFRFSADETKMKHEVHALVPRPLIGLLEEFLYKFRGQLLRGVDPNTLFVNHAGKEMTRSQLTKAVSTLTLRHGRRRVTPHLFRDVVAFTWLKEHPEDYLTLSKILWHSNISTTIAIYGSRFNESSGVRRMESWLEDRELKSK